MLRHLLFVGFFCLVFVFSAAVGIGFCVIAWRFIDGETPPSFVVLLILAALMYLVIFAVLSLRALRVLVRRR